MTIYPAIDLRNGRCVRLFQGKADLETIYFEDPSEPARKWREQGADHLHAVDLDAAFSGSSANLDAVRSILEVDGLKVQLEVACVTRIRSSGPWLLAWTGSSSGTGPAPIPNGLVL